MQDMQDQRQASEQAAEDEARLVEEIERLDNLAKQDPAGYKLRIAMLALLGYVYIFAVSIGLVLVSALFLVALVYFRVVFLLKFAWLFLLAAGLILKSMWVKFDAPKGIPLHRCDLPKLFALIDKIQTTAGVPTIHKVLMVDDFNCAVVQHPRLGLFGFHENIILLGLPLMDSLTEPEFEAVLGHEMGHLSSMHGRFGNWVYHVRMSWFQIYANLQKHGEGGAWPIHKFAMWFIPQFDKHTLALRRMQEFAADRLSSDMCGAQVMADALTSCEIRGAYVEREFWPSVAKRESELSEPPAGVYRMLAQKVRGEISYDDILKYLRPAWKKHHGFDSHPALYERVAALLPDGDWSTVEPTAKTVAARAGFQSSAAEVLLEGKYDELCNALSDEWCKVVAGPWRLKHIEMLEARKSFDRLNKIFEESQLTEEQAEEFAILCGSVREPEEALSIQQRLAERYPNMGAPQFSIGLYWLNKEADECIEYLKKAGELSPQYAHLANTLIAAHLRGKGQDEEARKYEHQAATIGELMDAEAKKSSKITNADVFLPHDLSESRLQLILDSLHAELRVKKAYIVRREISELLGGSQYLMVVELGSPHWYLVDQEHLRKAMYELVLLPEFEGFTILEWGGLPKNLADACKTLPGAMVYDRAVLSKSESANERARVIAARRPQAVAQVSFFRKNRKELIGFAVLGSIIVAGLNCHGPARRDTESSTRARSSGSENYRFVRHNDFGSYMEAMQHAIKQHWYPRNEIIRSECCCDLRCSKTDR
jgi:Zn-dependent protease with chaperone function